MLSIRKTARPEAAKPAFGPETAIGVTAQPLPFEAHSLMATSPFLTVHSDPVIGHFAFDFSTRTLYEPYSNYMVKHL
jgi:hypothetical protein